MPSGLEARREANHQVEQAARLNFSPAAFVQLMDIRAGQRDRKQLQAVAVATEYLRIIEQVAAAVDTIEVRPKLAADVEGKPL